MTREQDNKRQRGVRPSQGFEHKTSRPAQPTRPPGQGRRPGSQQLSGYLPRPQAPTNSFRQSGQESERSHPSENLQYRAYQFGGEEQPPAKQEKRRQKAASGFSWRTVFLIAATILAVLIVGAVFAPRLLTLIPGKQTPTPVSIRYATSAAVGHNSKFANGPSTFAVLQIGADSIALEEYPDGDSSSVKLIVGTNLYGLNEGNVDITVTFIMTSSGYPDLQLQVGTKTYDFVNSPKDRTFKFKSS